MNPSQYFPRRAFTTRKSGAFTLIELLIVIAIIAVIAAILFPVFASAREKGRQAACISNTRQVATAILMYAQDYEEVLPPVAYEEESTGDDVDWLELVTPYVKNRGVYLCPSDTSSKRISYGLNELAFVDLTDDGPDTNPPRALSDFRTPASTAMLGEVGTKDDYREPVPDVFKMVAPSGTLNDADDARPSPRHFNRVSVGFMDGHVKGLMLGQFYINQTPLDRYFAPRGTE